MSTFILPEYLGDGVYAHCDGFGIVLTTGDHDPARADNVIVLEPEVLEAFEKYRVGLKAHCAEELKRAADLVADADNEGRRIPKGTENFHE